MYDLHPEHYELIDFFNVLAVFFSSFRLAYIPDLGYSIAFIHLPCQVRDPRPSAFPLLHHRIRIIRSAFSNEEILVS